MFGRQSHVPKYRLHKGTGQALVEVNGRRTYLGPYGSAKSLDEYNRVIGEWKKRSVAVQAEAERQRSQRAVETMAVASAAQTLAASVPVDLTINEIILRYTAFCDGYYRRDGISTGTAANTKLHLRYLKRSFGRTIAREFGPKRLLELQTQLTRVKTDRNAKLSRKYINDTVARVKQMFKWAASRELVPPDVFHALATVEGLRKGRSDARETPKVRPVPIEDVDATLPFLPAIPAAMVKLQLLSGCRPGELCILRPMDVERRPDGVLVYRPASHKTQEHGHDRRIYIGPKARLLLQPFLNRDPSAFCFSPKESEQQRSLERRANRQTPMTPSQRQRRPKPDRVCPPADRYTPWSFRRVIHRACKRAGVPLWSPHRLRHARGTEIRERYGLEGSQVILGHAKVDATQIYAEVAESKAIAIVREVG